MRKHRRPDGLNKDTPQWLLGSTLPARVCNVLTANGVTDEAALRQMLAVPGGEAVFFKMANMGKKSVHELMEWAKETTVPAFEPNDIVVVYSPNYRMYWGDRGYTFDVSQAERLFYSDAAQRILDFQVEKGLQIHRVIGPIEEPNEVRK